MTNEKDSAVTIVIAYVFNLILLCVFTLFLVLRIVRVRGWKNFPFFHRGIMVVSNHQTLWDWLISYAVCSFQSALRPIIFGPRAVADMHNYAHKRRYAVFGSYIIPIDRTGIKQAKTRESRLRLLQNWSNLSKERLDQGGWVILYPETGRTNSGKTWIYSKLGKKIRPLGSGFSLLASETDCNIFPWWIDWKWYGVDVELGVPRRRKGDHPKKIAEETEFDLLELADKAG